MLTMIVGLFDRAADAQAAAEEIEDEGVPHGQVSVVKDLASSAADADPDLSDVLKVSIPGLGAACGRGPLVRGTPGNAGAGAIASGLAGALVRAGVDEEHAYEYLDGVRRGGTLVAAHVDPGRIEPVRNLLRRHGAVDVDRRAEQWHEQDARVNGRRQDTIWGGVAPGSVVNGTQRQQPQPSQPLAPPSVVGPIRTGNVYGEPRVAQRRAG